MGKINEAERLKTPFILELGLWKSECKLAKGLLPSSRRTGGLRSGQRRCVTISRAHKAHGSWALPPGDKIYLLNINYAPTVPWKSAKRTRRRLLAF